MHTADVYHTTAYSHIIAITAEFIPGKYDRSHLEHLLERVSDKIRGAHRPKKTASGTQVQPDDVDDQEMEDDDHWEDLDLDMDWVHCIQRHKMSYAAHSATYVIIWCHLWLQSMRFMYDVIWHTYDLNDAVWIYDLMQVKYMILYEV